MVSLSLFIKLVLIFLSQIIINSYSQPDFHCTDCQGNRTKTFTKNLNQLFSVINSDTNIDNGFYNFSVGQDPDTVYGVGVCRGDLTVPECKSCLNDATSKFQRVCLTSNESIGYYASTCLLQYSYRPIFGLRDSTPNCTFSGRLIPEEPYVEKLNNQVTTMFSGLIREAATGDPRNKLATGVANVTSSIKVYGLTHCNPDLSSSDCSTCLQKSVAELKLCCSGTIGGEVSVPSCRVEFQNYKFYYLAGGSNSPSVPSLFGPKSARARSNTGKAVYIAAGIGGFGLLIAIALFFFISRRRQARKEAQSNQIKCVDYMEFDFSTILAATDNFSDANRLRRGDSEKLYKGMLTNGQEIAVKRLFKKNKDAELKFNNEVLLLTNLQHRNLVKLLGFCIQKDVLLLVYEFLPNESLDWFLHDPAKRANLDWETRYNIILGIARGLHYLQEDSQLRVIHQDLRASNILLGIEMKPKISNFSRARHNIHDDQTRGATSTIKRTYGYMPPECARQGQFSAKSDIFSFGVILIEIISGQMISNFSNIESDEMDLLSYAWSKWCKNITLELVDPMLQKTENHITQMLRCIKIGLLCVQEDPTSRPTMAAVTFMLNNSAVAIKEPLKPAHMAHEHHHTI